jgi:hypothetical protein
MGEPERAEQVTAATTDRTQAPVGDWLVVPGPPFERMWRWGRILEVPDGDGPVHCLVRWFGDTQDTVVLPPDDARIESASE